MSEAISNIRPQPDRILVELAEYALQHEVTSKLAYDTARYCLMDTLGCGLEALSYLDCTKLIGPVIPGTAVQNGAKVPGTNFQLDQMRAAFSLGCMVRWHRLQRCLARRGSLPPVRQSRGNSCHRRLPEPHTRLARRGAAADAKCLDRDDQGVRDTGRAVA